MKFFSVQKFAFFLFLNVSIALSLILIASIATAFPGVSSGGSGETPVDETVVDKLKRFDEKIVSHLEFVGLVRTQERACRWLMKTTENKPFSSQDLAHDIQKLFNTGDLYEITPTIIADEKNPAQIRVMITLRDKWTLLPAGGTQGGGGALTYGGGLIETNLGGYFINAQAFAYNYNGVFSYDINFNQEYIAGSQIMGYLDWSNNVNPTVIHNIDDSSAGGYTWQRQQEEVMAGTHFENARLLVISDLYYDSLPLSNGVNASIYNGTQYRLQPKLIIGRANIDEFLEDGYELTFHPSTANFFGPVQAYQGVDASFKYIKALPHRANWGFLVFGGAMTKAPSPYEYEVGGYYNLRGFSDSRQIGNYVSYTNVEYRPYLFSHRFSWSEIDLVVVQACFFTDAGSSFGDSHLTGDPASAQFNLLWSAGAGIRVNFLHFAGAIMRMDLARTIHPDEGLGLSFGVGQFF